MPNKPPVTVIVNWNTGEVLATDDVEKVLRVVDEMQESGDHASFVSQAGGTITMNAPKE